MAPNNLSTSQQNQIVQYLLQNSKEGKPLRGKFNEVAARFQVSRRTVSRLWSAAKKQQVEGQVIHLISGQINVKRNKTVDINLELIASLDLLKIGTIRKLAIGINCSKSTVGRWVSKGLIRAHTSAIKSDLTAPNKLLRLRFSLEALEVNRLLKSIKFRSMHNTIHIDEKWFYITKGTHKFYMTPGEAEPHRTCKSKKFITKIMFMCAVCRPMYAVDGSLIFDGKIGIFPFTQQVPARRKSKNRAAGTIETKPIESITKEVIKNCLINQIIPSIKAKWPACASKNIFIQQDNARPHIKNNDLEFRTAACSDGFNIILVHQPPNSPDTNVNDLGWFRAIQSIQIESMAYTVDQLVNAVELSFQQLSPTTLNNVFLSLQGCMIEIMKVRGQNCYKLPHMKKGTLIREERLPVDLEVSEVLVRECITYLTAARSLEGIGDLMEDLGIARIEES